MDIMLKIGFPAILIVVGVVCLLVSKRNDSKPLSLVGLVSALAGVAWIVIGTF